MGATTSTTATPTIILGTAAPYNGHASIVNLNAQTSNPLNMMVFNQLRFQIKLSGVENAAISTLPTQLTLLLINWIKGVPHTQDIVDNFDIIMQVYMAIIIVQKDLAITLNYQAIMNSVCGQSFTSTELTRLQIPMIIDHMQYTTFVFTGDAQYYTDRAELVSIIPTALPTSGGGGASMHVARIHNGI